MKAASPPAERAERRPSLDALTGLRFFAASWVVLYHYAGAALSAGAPAWLRHAVGHGYVGVNFFYLLSGFILAYNYAERRDDGSLRMRGTRAAFWKNRVSRVYPLYVVAWLAALPFVVEHRLAADSSLASRAAKLGTSALVSLGLVQAWIPGASAWWNPPGWSISVEAFFYAVFPWLLPRIVPLRNRAAFALGLWLASLIVPAVYILVGGNDLVLSAVKFTPLLHAPTFAFGIWLAAAFDSPWRSRMEPFGGVFALVGVLAVVLVVRRAPGPLYPLIHNGLLTPAFALVVLGVALGLPRIDQVLGSRPLVALGEASFGVYILQAPLRLAWMRAVTSISAGVDVGLFFLGLCLVSLAAHRLIELPAQRWLRRATIATSTR